MKYKIPKGTMYWAYPTLNLYLDVKHGLTTRYVVYDDSDLLATQSSTFYHFRLPPEATPYASILFEKVSIQLVEE